MMKELCIVLFLFFTQLQDILSKQIEADSNSGILHFYRPKSYVGSATSIKLSINGTYIGKLKNGLKIDFLLKSEGVIKIEASSSSPKYRYSYKIQVNHGEDHYIKLSWTTAYAFRIYETKGTDGATEYFNEDLFKGNNAPLYLEEGSDYPIRIFEKQLSSGSKKKIDLTKVQSTGTGFFISSSGYLVSNYHVIEDYNKIFIKNIYGDRTKKYEAIPIVEDRINDLVILKITDDKFKGLDEIPYQMDTRLADVGENVFALGYPLTTTMGKEVKLTNGIISSRTGFANNVVTYQISVPVQPGNSGGPLFNIHGRLIGVICAIHEETDNVSYAVKANYLVNLIDLLPSEDIFSDSNLLEGKKLVEQVKSIQKFVVLIEIY